MTIRCLIFLAFFLVVTLSSRWHPVEQNRYLMEPFPTSFLYQPRGKESLSWFLRGTKWDALRVNIWFKQIQLSNTRLLSSTPYLPYLNEPNFHEVCGNLQGTFVPTNEGLVFWSWGQYPGKKEFRCKKTWELGWTFSQPSFNKNHCTWWFWKRNSVKVAIKRQIWCQGLLRLVRKRFAEVSPVYILYNDNMI